MPEFASSGVQLNGLRVKAAKIEDEWLSIFGTILENLRRVYIVLDIEAMDYESSKSGGGFWPMAFLELIRDLKNRGAQITAKVLLISCGSSLSLLTLSEAGLSEWVSGVKMPRREFQQKMRPGRMPMRSRGRLVQRATRGNRGR